MWWKIDEKITNDINDILWMNMINIKKIIWKKWNEIKKWNKK